jgi:predicted nucleic acid-binding protein
MTKNNYVFDTGPLYLYFTDDKKVNEPFREVIRGSASGSTTELNLAELYYKTCEKIGREAALLRYISLRKGSVDVVRPDDVLTRIAGELKCSHAGQLSLTDAYTIALARRERAELFTTDPRIARLKVVPTKLIELE